MSGPEAKGAAKPRVRLLDEHKIPLTIIDSPAAAYGKQPTTVTFSPLLSLRRSTV